MLARRALLIAASLDACVAPVCFSSALARSQPRAADPGVVSDDELSLVVGTHFVSSSADDVSLKSQFTDSRIPSLPRRTNLGIDCKFGV